MDLVFDASVFVKLLRDEPGTERAIELEASSQLVAPDWLLAETGMVLWKKVRRGVLTPAEALESLAVAERYDAEFVPAQQLLPEALALACEIPHPLYDTLYLTLALHGGRTLATADARMREAAEALGIKVEWVGAA